MAALAPLTSTTESDAGSGSIAMTDEQAKPERISKKIMTAIDAIVRAGDRENERGRLETAALRQQRLVLGWQRDEAGRI